MPAPWPTMPNNSSARWPRAWSPPPGCWSYARRRVRPPRLSAGARRYLCSRWFDQAVVDGASPPSMPHRRPAAPGHRSAQLCRYCMAPVVSAQAYCGEACEDAQWQITPTIDGEVWPTEKGWPEGTGPSSRISLALRPTVVSPSTTQRRGRTCFHASTKYLNAASIFAEMSASNCDCRSAAAFRLSRPRLIRANHGDGQGQAGGRHPAGQG
jgi:hypothetical protein